MKGFSYWDLVWEEAPDAADRFAMGLWNHQIYSHEGKRAGEFSRHATALFHWPFWGKGFPSHGGKYIEIWTRAWQETGNPEYLTAISTLLDYFERNISPTSGALRYATKFPDQYSLGHNMGFNHDPTPGGTGFIKSAHVHTLVPGEYRSEHKGGSYTTKMWSSGYGAADNIGSANNCLDRYNQTGIGKYKELFMISAEAYYAADVPETKILYPGNYSGAIGMMMNAYGLTGEKRFLEKVITYADLSINAVMDDSSPLPKASNQNDHYEAITGANGLMSNLLNIWMELNRDSLK